jgi:antitoxin MazE
MDHLARKDYRKLGRMGNSFGISLPKEMLAKMNAKRGDLFEIVYEEGTITIRPAKYLQMDEDDLSLDMLKALDHTFKKYDHALRQLKDR